MNETQRPTNKDFSRVMTLLRKERGISQKTAASDLGITQALLSHYEKGKRECGLDFLVRAADYYNVSVDYLLGRTSSSSGVTVSGEELPDSTVSEKLTGSLSDAPTLLRKKLITNSIEIVFSLLIKTRNSELAKAVSNYLSTAVYRSYRMVYSAGEQNDENSFAIPVKDVAGKTAAAMSLYDIKANAAASSGSLCGKITSGMIEEEYPKQSAALFSVVTNTEKSLGKLDI